VDFDDWDRLVVDLLLIWPCDLFDIADSGFIVCTLYQFDDCKSINESRALVVWILVN
jgi:hypothetical protein